MKRKIGFLLVVLVFWACSSSAQMMQLYQMNEKLIELTVRDQLSPPVASRMLAYCNLSYYMVFHINDPQEHLLKEIFENRKIMSVSSPEIGTPLDTMLVANYVFLKTASALAYDTMFTHGGIVEFESMMKPDEKNYAHTILSNMKKLMGGDGFKERTSLKRYEEQNDTLSYRLTPPAYRLPIEPHWQTIKPFLVSDVDSFLVVNEFTEANLDKFDKVNKTLYKKSLKYGNKENQIAYFWDCNPVHMSHVGHAMKVTYRMTPAGHWVSIISECVKDKNIQPGKLSFIYALSTIAMADAFIITWKNKYKSNFIRPVTYINTHFDTKWTSYMETPSFPEYPSGHSTISSTCSYILTQLLGSKVSFVDKSQMPYAGTIRSYKSFDHAAREAGTSRYYGGIHYLNAINDGYRQGQMIGGYIWKKVN